MSAFLFGVLPYLAVAVAVAGAFRRFGALRATVTTGSSQLLEDGLLHWGSVPWHGAILAVLLLHLLAVLFPGAVSTLLGAPLRLLVVEATGLALGLTALAGLLVLCVRRAGLRAATGWLDWLVLALLLLQVGTGVYTALTARWGYAWFTGVATPWLASLALLAPRPDLLAPMPPLFQAHALNAFLLLALVPYTRLAHALVAPIAYLWRAPQLVVWRRARPAAPGGRP